MRQRVWARRVVSRRPRACRAAAGEPSAIRLGLAFVALGRIAPGDTRRHSPAEHRGLTAASQKVARGRPRSLVAPPEPQMAPSPPGRPGLRGCNPDNGSRCGPFRHGLGTSPPVRRHPLVRPWTVLLERRAVGQTVAAEWQRPDPRMAKWRRRASRPLVRRPRLSAIGRTPNKSCRSPLPARRRRDRTVRVHAADGRAECPAPETGRRTDRLEGVYLLDRRGETARRNDHAT